MPRRDVSNIIQTQALKRVQGLSRDEVLASLKEGGITSLDDLVDNVLDFYRESEGFSGNPVAYDTFIYTQFVYKAALQLDFDKSIILAQPDG